MTKFRHALSKAKTALFRMREESGGVAVIFALAVIPLALLAGAAIDYQRAAATRTRMQTALDAAVLAGVRESVPENRAKVAATVFSSNVAALGIAAPAAQFVLDPDGTFVGRSTGQTPTAFMRVVNVESIEIGAKSRAFAPPAVLTPTSLTFTALSAKGWFWKGVTLWVHRPGAATDTALATYIYQPTDLTSNGTGTTTGPFGTPIAVGSNYDNLYLTMTVYPDGCAPDQAPLHPEAIDNYDTNYWSPYVCLPVSPSGVQKTAVPYTMSTNDPATANHLFVDGTHLPTGSSANVLALTKCGNTVTHGWEDTKEFAPMSDAWQTQDFNFDVTSGGCAANTAIVNAKARLIE